MAGLGNLFYSIDVQTKGLSKVTELEEALKSIDRPYRIMLEVEGVSLIKSLRDNLVDAGKGLQVLEDQARLFGNTIRSAFDANKDIQKTTEAAVELGKAITKIFDKGDVSGFGNIYKPIADLEKGIASIWKDATKMNAAQEKVMTDFGKWFKSSDKSSMTDVRNRLEKYIQMYEQLAKTAEAFYSELERTGQKSEGANALKTEAENAMAFAASLREIIKLERETKGGIQVVKDLMSSKYKDSYMDMFEGGFEAMNKLEKKVRATMYEIGPNATPIVKEAFDEFRKLASRNASGFRLDNLEVYISEFRPARDSIIKLRDRIQQALNSTAPIEIQFVGKFDDDDPAKGILGNTNAGSRSGSNTGSDSTKTKYPAPPKTLKQDTEKRDWYKSKLRELYNENKDDDDVKSWDAKNFGDYESFDEFMKESQKWTVKGQLAAYRKHYKSLYDKLNTAERVAKGDIEGISDNGGNASDDAQQPAVDEAQRKLNEEKERNAKLEEEKKKLQEMLAQKTGSNADKGKTGNTEIDNAVKDLEDQQKRQQDLQKQIEDLKKAILGGSQGDGKPTRDDLGFVSDKLGDDDVSSLAEGLSPEELKKKREEVRKSLEIAEKVKEMREAEKKKISEEGSGAVNEFYGRFKQNDYSSVIDGLKLLKNAADEASKSMVSLANNESDAAAGKLLDTHASKNGLLSQSLGSIIHDLESKQGGANVSVKWNTVNRAVSDSIEELERSQGVLTAYGATNSNLSGITGAILQSLASEAGAIKDVGSAAAESAKGVSELNQELLDSEKNRRAQMLSDLTSNVSEGLKTSKASVGRSFEDYKGYKSASDKKEEINDLVDEINSKITDATGRANKLRGFAVAEPKYAEPFNAMAMQFDRAAERMSDIVGKVKEVKNTDAFRDILKDIETAVSLYDTALVRGKRMVDTYNSEFRSEGGKIVGPGSGTSDSIKVNVSNGEFVVNSAATKAFEPLLEFVNSLGNGKGTAEGFKNAMSNWPAFNGGSILANGMVLDGVRLSDSSVQNIKAQLEEALGNLSIGKTKELEGWKVSASNLAIETFNKVGYAPKRPIGFVDESAYQKQLEDHEGTLNAALADAFAALNENSKRFEYFMSVLRSLYDGTLTESDINGFKVYENLGKGSKASGQGTKSASASSHVVMASPDFDGSSTSSTGNRTEEIKTYQNAAKEEIISEEKIVQLIKEKTKARAEANGKLFDLTDQLNKMSGRGNSAIKKNLEERIEETKKTVESLDSIIRLYLQVYKKATGKDYDFPIVSYTGPKSPEPPVQDKKKSSSQTPPPELEDISELMKRRYDILSWRVNQYADENINQALRSKADDIEKKIAKIREGNKAKLADRGYSNEQIEAMLAAQEQFALESLNRHIQRRTKEAMDIDNMRTWENGYTSKSLSEQYKNEDRASKQRDRDQREQERLDQMVIKQDQRDEALRLRAIERQARFEMKQQKTYAQIELTKEQRQRDYNDILQETTNRLNILKAQQKAAIDEGKSHAELDNVISLFERRKKALEYLNGREGYMQRAIDNEWNDKNNLSTAEAIARIRDAANTKAGASQDAKNKAVESALQQVIKTAGSDISSLMRTRGTISATGDTSEITARINELQKEKKLLESIDTSTTSGMQAASNAVKQFTENLASSREETARVVAEQRRMNAELAASDRKKRAAEIKEEADDFKALDKAIEDAEKKILYLDKKAQKAKARKTHYDNYESASGIIETKILSSLLSARALGDRKLARASANNYAANLRDVESLIAGAEGRTQLDDAASTKANREHESEQKREINREKQFLDLKQKTNDKIILLEEQRKKAIHDKLTTDELDKVIKKYKQYYSYLDSIDNGNILKRSGLIRDALNTKDRMQSMMSRRERVARIKDSVTNGDRISQDKELERQIAKEDKDRANLEKRLNAAIAQARQMKSQLDKKISDNKLKGEDASILEARSRVFERDTITSMRAAHKSGDQKKMETALGKFTQNKIYESEKNHRAETEQSIKNAAKRKADAKTTRDVERKIAELVKEEADAYRQLDAAIKQCETSISQLKRKRDAMMVRGENTSYIDAQISYLEKNQLDPLKNVAANPIKDAAAAKAAVQAYTKDLLVNAEESSHAVEIQRKMNRIDKKNGKDQERIQNEAKRYRNSIEGRITELERLKRTYVDVVRTINGSNKTFDNSAARQELDILISRLSAMKGMGDRDLVSSYRTFNQKGEYRNGKAEAAKLATDTKKIADEEKRAADESERLGRSQEAIHDIANRIGSIMTQYFGFSAMKRLAEQVITIGGEFEKQHVALESMLGSASKADELFSQMKGLAIESPFTFQQLTGYTKQLAAFSIPYKEMYDTTKRLADISSGLGVDMGRIILAYGQVRSAAYLRGQELRQFTEAGIPLLEKLADRFSQLEGRAVSVGEVFTKISKRQVSFDMVKDIMWGMTDEGGQFFDMQQRLTNTISGQMQKLKDVQQQSFGEMSESHSTIFNVILSTLTEIIKNWKLLQVLVEGAAIGTMFGTMANQGSRVVRSLIAARQAAAKLGGSLGWIQAFSGWIGLAAGAAGILLASIFEIVSSLDEYKNKIKEIERETNSKISSMQDGYRQLVNSLNKAVEGTTEYKEIIDQINNRYGEYLDHLFTERDTYNEIAKSIDIVTEAIARKHRQEQYERSMNKLNDKYEGKLDIVGGFNGNRRFLAKFANKDENGQNIEVLEKTSKAIRSQLANYIKNELHWFDIADDGTVVKVAKSEIDNQINTFLGQISESYRLDRKLSITDFNIGESMNTIELFLGKLENYKNEEMKILQKLHGYSPYNEDVNAINRVYADLKDSIHGREGYSNPDYIEKLENDKKRITKIINTLQSDKYKSSRNAGVIAEYKRELSEINDQLQGFNIQAYKFFNKQWDISFTLPNGKKNKSFASFEDLMPSKDDLSNFSGYIDRLVAVAESQKKDNEKLEKLKEQIGNTTADWKAGMLIWNQESDLVQGKQKLEAIKEFLASIGLDLQQLIDDKNKGKGKGTGKDRFEEIFNGKMKVLNNAYSKYKEWYQLYSTGFTREDGTIVDAIAGDAERQNAAFQELVNAHMFDEFPELKAADLENLKDSYKKLFSDIEKIKDPEKRKAAREELWNKILGIDTDEAKKTSGFILDRFDKSLEEEGKKWNFFETLVKAGMGTGDASVVAGVSGKFANYAEALKAMLETELAKVGKSGVSLIELFSMGDSEIIESGYGERVKRIVSALKSQTDSYKQEVQQIYSDLRKQFASSLDDIVALEQEHEKRVAAINANEKDQNKRKQLLEQVDSDFAVKAMKASSEYFKLMNAGLALSEADAEDYAKKFRATLDDALRRGAIKADDYAKNIEEINSAMDKIKSRKNAFMSYLNGGISSVVDARKQNAQDQRKAAASDIQKYSGMVSSYQKEIEEFKKQLSDSFASGSKDGIGNAMSGMLNSQSGLDKAQSSLAAAEGNLAAADGAEAAAGEFSQALAVVDTIVHLIDGIIQGIKQSVDLIDDMNKDLGRNVDENDAGHTFIDAFSQASGQATSAFDAMKNGDVAGLISGVVGSWTKWWEVPAEHWNAKMRDVEDQAQKRIDRLSAAIDRASDAMERFGNNGTAALADMQRSDALLKKQIAGSNGSVSDYEKRNKALTSISGLNAKRDELQERFDYLYGRTHSGNNLTFENFMKLGGPDAQLIAQLSPTFATYRQFSGLWDQFENSVLYKDELKKVSAELFRVAEAADAIKKVGLDDDVFANLSDTGKVYASNYLNLIDQRMELERQLDAENRAKDTDPEKLNDYEDKLREINKEIADSFKEMYKELYDLDLTEWASEISDALVDAFKNGTDAVTAFEDSVNGMMQNIGKRIIEQAINTKYINKLMTELFGEDGNGGAIGNFKGSPEDAIQKALGIFAKFVNENGEDLTDFAKGLYEGLSEHINWNGAGSTGLSKSVSGITEETADVIAAYLAGIRLDTSNEVRLLENIDFNVAGIAESLGVASTIQRAGAREGGFVQENNLENVEFMMNQIAYIEMPKLNVTAEAQLAQLNMIAAHTLAIRDNTAMMAEYMSTMSEDIHRSATGVAPLHIQ